MFSPAKFFQGAAALAQRLVGTPEKASPGGAREGRPGQVQAGDARRPGQGREAGPPGRPQVLQGGGGGAHQESGGAARQGHAGEADHAGVDVPQLLPDAPAGGGGGAAAGSKAHGGDQGAGGAVGLCFGGGEGRGGEGGRQGQGALREGDADLPERPRQVRGQGGGRGGRPPLRGPPGPQGLQEGGGPPPPEEDEAGPGQVQPEHESQRRGDGVSVSPRGGRPRPAIEAA